MGGEARDILIRTADRIFTEIATPQRLLEAEAEGGRWLADGWALVEDAGLTLALVPEEAGGFDLSMSDALVVVRRAGAFAVPLPLAETMIANRLLAIAGVTLPGGALSIATGAKSDHLELRRDGRNWHVSGELFHVPWGRFVDHVVAVVDGAVLLLPRPAEGIFRGNNLAGEARDRLQVDQTLPSASVGVDAVRDGMSLRQAGAAMRSIAIAGAVERMLEMTTNYAGERIQFGRSISKFQAIQQYLAAFAGHVAAASAAADIAVDALESENAAFSIAVAKVRSSEAAGAAAALAHQIHGAIGISQEYGLHFISRRLWSWRDEFGNEAEWASLIGREAVAVGADGLWPLVVAA